MSFFAWAADRGHTLVNPLPSVGGDQSGPWIVILPDAAPSGGAAIAPVRLPEPVANDLLVVREWDEFMAAQDRSDRTRALYKYALLRFLAQCCPEDLRGIDESDVAAFLATLGTHAASKSQYMRGLRSFFGWAARRGYVPGDPTEWIQPKNPPKPPVVALSDEELDAYFAAAAARGERRGAALRLTYALGARRSEACGIRPKDIDLAAGYVTLWKTKGGKPRQVELGPRALLALEDLRPWRDPTILGVGAQTLTEWAHDAAVATGLVHRVRRRPAHVLRATFATKLLHEGIPIDVVSDLLGHSNVGVTSRYLAVHEQDRRRAVELL